MENSTEATATWFVIVGGAESGPFTSSVVQLYMEIGELSADDMCWREGFPDWIPLGQTVEFGAHLPPTSPPPEPSLETPAQPAGPASPLEGIEAVLPSSPVVHDDQSNPRQSENSIKRIWRGEFSLPKNRWVNAYGLTALPIILAVGLWQTDFVSQPSRTLPVAVKVGTPQPGRLAEVETAMAIALKKPLDNRLSDVEPPAIKPSDNNLSDAKPSDTRPPAAKPSDNKLSDIKPTDIKLAAIEPLAIKPLDIRPLDVAGGMRAISAIPIYAAIKEKYPAEYPKMEEVLRDGFVKGWSTRDLRTRILPFLTAYYQRSLPTASPAAIEKFLGIVAAEQEAILQVNASSCMAYMKGDASGYSASEIPAELTARELEIGAEIIRSTGDYQGPAITEKEIQKSLSRVVSGASRSLGMPVGEYLKGLNLKLDGTANCEVVIAFYKHLAELTSEERPKLLRFIVQSIMLPKA
jgi:hypothetical protein